MVYITYYNYHYIPEKTSNDSWSLSTRCYLKPQKFHRRAVEEDQDLSRLAGDHVDGVVDPAELFLDAFEKSRQTDRRLRLKCKHNWAEPYFSSQ